MNRYPGNPKLPPALKAARAALRASPSDLIHMQAVRHLEKLYGFPNTIAADDIRRARFMDGRRPSCPIRKPLTVIHPKEEPL